MTRSPPSRKSAPISPRRWRPVQATLHGCRSSPARKRKRIACWKKRRNAGSICTSWMRKSARKAEGKGRKSHRLPSGRHAGRRRRKARIQTARLSQSVQTERPGQVSRVQNTAGQNPTAVHTGSPSRRNFLRLSAALRSSFCLWPPLRLCAAALPACRRHILPLGPLLLLFQKTLMRHRGNSAVSRSGKEKHGQRKNFLSFLKKRLAFLKIIGYNNQALERNVKKQNMDD